MSDSKFSWIIFAIGISSGTFGGFLIALLGGYGIWTTREDEE